MRKIAFSSRIVLAIGVLAGVLASSAIAAGGLTAPYQIDGVLNDTFDGTRFGDPPSLGPTRVLVDLGVAREAVPPVREDFERMALIGTRGLSNGGLIEITKTCRYLCGDDGEACHWVAVLALEGSLDDLGTPLAAVTLTAGTPKLEAFRSFSAVDEEDGPVPAEWLDREFAADAWSVASSNPTEYRIVSTGEGEGAIAIETRYAQGQVYKYESGECRRKQVPPFGVLECSMFATILDGARPVLVSLADYGGPTAQVLAALESSGRTHFVVRLGLKAQTAVGLLVRTEDGWRVLLRPRNHALLC